MAEAIIGGERLVIGGGPRSGKTTLAVELALKAGVGGRVRHTDGLKDSHGWSEMSLEVSRWFDEPGPWVIEGAAAFRALRKWLANGGEGKPCDRVLYLTGSYEELDGWQAGMVKAIRTVFQEIEGELRKRGVEIEIGSPDNFKEGLGMPESEEKSTARTVAELPAACSVSADDLTKRVGRSDPGKAAEVVALWMGEEDDDDAR